MSIEPYPASRFKHLVRRVQDTEKLGIDRDWTGNDRSARNHNGVVRLNESPLRLRLSWKESPNDPVRRIGIFELDLRKLLAERYVRIEPRVRDAIRLRFYHGMDDVIYIQTNNGGIGLPVGEFPR